MSRLWLYAVTPASLRISASSGPSSPRVTQTSMPSLETSRMVSTTWSNLLVPLRTPRQAAPMQKRVEPVSLAICARFRISSFSMRRSTWSPELWRDDWAQ